MSEKTKIGWLYIEEDCENITKIQFKRADCGTKTSLLKRTFKEINEYLSGTRKRFTVPIFPRGSEFQLKIWTALLEIPYGETRTYKQIAKSIGNEHACRAVGRANNKNPIPIIIPCHRVVGSDGTLTGYSGGVILKEKLLRIEQG